MASALAEVEGVGEVEKQFEIAKVHLLFLRRCQAPVARWLGGGPLREITFQFLQRTVSNISVQAISVPRYSGFDNAAIRHGINRTDNHRG